MKKIFFLTTVSLTIFSMSFSCLAIGNSAMSQTSYNSIGNSSSKTQVDKEKINLDECEEESMREPLNELRAYASAVDDEREFAREEAILLAEAALVERMESLVESTMERYQHKVKVDGATLNQKEIVKDVKSQAQREIKNWKIICSNLYRLSDGNYEYHICVSIPNSIPETIIRTAIINESDRKSVKINKEALEKSYQEARIREEARLREKENM